MEDKLIRAAIYARVSSEQQAQANTIGSQVDALRERVASDGLTLDEELYFIDEGYSGSGLVRPALERLRDVAYAGGFGRLYVHSPDRLRCGSSLRPTASLSASTKDRRIHAPISGGRQSAPHTDGRRA